MTGAGTSVVVIGGGAVGLITAYHLHREGADVTLIDARQTGRGAAEVNAGWICPAESAPVPGPGMISKSLKWMLHRDSPLYIRPEPTSASSSSCSACGSSSNGPMQRAGFEAHLRLAHGTIEAYEDYRADGIDFELRHDGLLMAFTDRENLDHHRQLLDLAERFDRDPQVLIGDDVRKHEPLLSDRVYGGIFFPQEQHVDPARVDAVAAPPAGRGRRPHPGERAAGRRPDRARPDHRDHRRRPNGWPPTRTCSPPAPGPGRCPG